MNNRGESVVTCAIFIFFIFILISLIVSGVHYSAEDDKETKKEHKLEQIELVHTMAYCRTPTDAYKLFGETEDIKNTLPLKQCMKYDSIYVPELNGNYNVSIFFINNEFVSALFDSCSTSRQVNVTRLGDKYVVRGN